MFKPLAIGRVAARHGATDGFMIKAADSVEQVPAAPVEFRSGALTDSDRLDEALYIRYLKDELHLPATAREVLASNTCAWEIVATLGDELDVAIEPQQTKDNGQPYRENARVRSIVLAKHP